jgi:hypothetical protein
VPAGLGAFGRRPVRKSQSSLPSMSAIAPNARAARSDRPATSARAAHRSTEQLTRPAPVVRSPPPACDVRAKMPPQSGGACRDRSPAAAFVLKRLGPPCLRRLGRDRRRRGGVRPACNFRATRVAENARPPFWAPARRPAANTLEMRSAE